MKKRRINICKSGWRTSAFMTEMALSLQAQGYFSDVEFIVTFANTGREHEKTLAFVNECDKRWQFLYGVKVVWLEAVVHKERKPSSHKVVSFETASRKGEPFKAVVAKYGLPNKTFLHCTRELKENPVMSYMESIGERIGHIVDKTLVSATYETWIGIREDEPKRLGGKRNGKQYKVYPLAEPYGEVDITADKPDILFFWNNMPYDLDLPEHWGNCIDCHKKSDTKLNKVYVESKGNAFGFSKALDRDFSNVKPQALEDGSTMVRKRFRGYRNTDELIQSFELGIELTSEVNGCESSCEPFMNDNEAEAA